MRTVFGSICWGILSIVLISTFLLPTAAHSEANEAKGPLQTINRFPPHLMFLTPTPQSPRMVSRGGFTGSIAIDYTSMYMSEDSGQWDVLMDMEMTTIEFAGEYGLTHHFSLGFEVPFVSMNDGFLDDPLEKYHNTFGFPNYGKEDRPKNDFAYHIKKDKADGFDSKKSGLHLTDSKVSLKTKLMDQGDGSSMAASLLYTIKLPTGDEDYGFGSGRYDHGLFLLTQIPADPLHLYFSPGYILISDPKTRGADISGNDVVSLFIGAEYRLNKKWSLLGQINYYTSPIEKVGINKFDDGSAELSLGFIYSLREKIDLEFSFSEDLTRAVPDFTVHGRVVFRRF